MAFIPDNLVERRRNENVSQTACEFFIKYCECADKDSGLTYANVKTCADAFGIRSDNAKKYDDELISAGWIQIIETNGKIQRKVQAGWLSVTERKGQGKAENTKLLNFRKELEHLLNFREFSYILGSSPKFKEKLLNFRNVYKEYIDQSTNQLLNQLIDQTEKDTPDGDLSDVPKTDGVLVGSLDLPNETPKTRGRKTKPQTNKEPVIKLPEDFQITPEMRIWAKEKVPELDIDDELEEFVNFWAIIAQKNNKRTMRGWVATWQGRMKDRQDRTPNGLTKKNGANKNGTTKFTNYRDERAKQTIEKFDRDEQIRARVEERRRKAQEQLS